MSLSRASLTKTGEGGGRGASECRVAVEQRRSLSRGTTHGVETETTRDTATLRHPSLLGATPSATAPRSPAAAIRTRAPRAPPAATPTSGLPPARLVATILLQVALVLRLLLRERTLRRRGSRTPPRLLAGWGGGGAAAEAGVGAPPVAAASPLEPDAVLPAAAAPEPPAPWPPAVLRRLPPSAATLPRLLAVRDLPIRLRKSLMSESSRMLSAGSHEFSDAP